MQLPLNLLQELERIPYPLKNAVNDVNIYAAWLRLNQDVYKEDTELDFFVDEVMKRLTSRIKNRGY